MAEDINIKVKLDDETASGLGSVKSGFEGLNKVFTAGNVAAGAFSAALIKIGKDAVAAFSESQKIMVQTETVIRSTGGAAGYTAEQIQEMAVQFSRLTAFEDEAIQSAENVLLRYTAIGHDVLPKATEAILDFAEATGTDLDGAAKAMGKALQDPINSLGLIERGTMKFTDAQKENIKTFIEQGNLAKAQQVILDQMAQTFGGQAAAAVKTFDGAMRQMNTEVGNVLEVIGSNLVPVLMTLVQGIRTVAIWFQNLPAPIQKFVTVAGVLFALMAGAIPIIAAFTVAFGALQITILPVVAAVLAAAAAITAITLAVEHFSKKKKEAGVGPDKPTSSKPTDAPVQTLGKQDFEKELGELDNYLQKRVSMQQNVAEKEKQLQADTLANKGNLELQQLQLEATIQQERLNALDMWHDQELAKTTLTAEQKKQVEATYNQQRLVELQKQKDLQQKIKEAEFKDWQKWEDFMLQATQSKNKEVAAIAKALAIKNTAMKTYEAAMSGYNSMVGIPFVGPILGAAAAAAAIAFGMEQVDKITALAEGGTVPATAGGTMAQIGEAGKDEMVIPLDDPSTAERLQRSGFGGGGGGLTLIVQGNLIGNRAWIDQFVSEYRSLRKQGAVGDING